MFVSLPLSMAFWLKKPGTSEKELSKRLREKLNTQESMTILRVPNHPPHSPSPSPSSRSPFRGRRRSCDQSTGPRISQQVKYSR